MITENTDVQAWWAENPMSYGLTHGLTDYEDASYALGTRAFFDQADKRFMEWNLPLHDERGPFAKLFPFERFKNKSVLEVGCGMGFMSSLWAKNGSQVTAVDLNPTSIAQTKKRFELFQLEGNIQLEDANQMSLSNESFDYAYSWGVLHHSPNLEKSLAEFFRVLKPGGEFGIMLYSRDSLQYRYHIQYLEGYLHAESQFLNSLQLASRYGDGHREEGNPHTWPVTQDEMYALVGAFSKDLDIKVLGTDLDATFAHLYPGVSKFLPLSFKKIWARRLGWSLWAYGSKRA